MTNNKQLTFFVKNQCRSHHETPISLTPSFDNNIAIFGLYSTRLGNNQTKNGTKLRS